MANRITYDEPGFDGRQMPKAPYDGAKASSGRTFASAPGDGLSGSDAKRGFLAHGPTDPNYPMTPDFHRTAIADRHITRPDFYGQGDPHADETAKVYRELGLDPPKGLIRKE